MSHTDYMSLYTTRMETVAMIHVDNVEIDIPKPKNAIFSLDATKRDNSIPAFGSALETLHGK